MGRDISDILREWEYDPERTVRIVEADDGRRVLQIRQQLGIEQYELDGRPDGKLQEGRDCLLDVYLNRLEAYKSEHGTDEGFVLSHDDCTALQNESFMYYCRYLVLFQIGDFQRTVNDTDHNLALCDVIGKYGEKEEDRRQILQYRPYILRMNAVSKAMIGVSQELVPFAQQQLEAAIREIESMPDVDTPVFEIERMRSLDVLRSVLKQVMERKPSPAAQLERRLQEAVAGEDYELAARLRDRIRLLKGSETE